VVDGTTLTIIGVSQQGFSGVAPGLDPQIRVPITMDPELPHVEQYRRVQDRRFRWVEVFGGLKPGMTLEKAQAGLQPLFNQIINGEVQEKEFARASPFVRQEFLKMWMEVIPGSRGRNQFRNNYAKPLLALMAIVGLVLLIACSNLANLLVARASARQKEIALRLALGAARGQLVAQLLVESLMLSIAGGVLGLGLAVVIDRALLTFLPSNTIASSITSTPDWTVLGFTTVVSIAAGVIFGLIPALHATRPKIANTLKDEAAAVVHGGSIVLRKGLVVAQVALSLVLLIGAGLFLGTLRNLEGLHPGFEVHDLLAFAVEPTMNRYDKPWTREYYRRLTERLQTLPGVESAALAVVPLLQDNEWDNWVTIEGYTPKVGERPDPHMQYCSDNLFATLKIPVLLGRDFNAKDISGGGRVGIVNQKFAKRYFGDANPLGRHLGFGIDPGTKLDVEIVGVVGDTKYEDLRQEIPEELYVPYTQPNSIQGMTAYVRTRGEPTAVFNVLRQVVRDVDPAVPMNELRTMDEQVNLSLRTEQLLATLSGVFGGLATLLAALGLYGVMAYTVARRTREIGIRMALGANTGNVVGMVMREVLVMASFGIAIGLTAGWAATRLVKTQLFGVDAADPRTLVLAALGIATVAAASGYLPARRATRIDPVQALHWE